MQLSPAKKASQAASYLIQEQAAVQQQQRYKPIARNSVPNDNRNVNIDLPRQEEKLLRSTNDYNNRQNLSKVAVGNATVKKSSVAITNGRTPITAAMTEESALEENCTCSASSSATQNNHANMTTKTLIPILEEAVQSSMMLAPWDASEAVGGSELIKNACEKEIEQSQCHGRLPLYTCLMGYNKSIEWLSPECKRVVNRCSVEGSSYEISGVRECSNIIGIFQHSALNGIEVRRLESILQRMDESLSNKNIQYWMAASSTIGGLYHHSRIPWDDDVDMYVLDEDVASAVDELVRAGLGVMKSDRNGRVFKIYDPSLPAISKKYKHSYPFVDFFSIHCNKTICAEKNEWASGVENRYGQDAKDRCIRHAYNHKKERFRGREHHMTVRCDDLPLPPPFVVSASSANETSFQGRAMEDRPFIRPWASDLPDVTVEHLMDNNTRLSTVTFYDGHEIRRSYADGLMNTNGKITFHNESLMLAKDLNLEVMPMLNIPEFGNDFVTESASDQTLSRLTIAEWNAERGTNWHVLPNFIPNADIIILNEMDWGMARSSNNHTIRSMANSLRMNYAYGVEFLELTNGNAGEINATKGMKNAAGYHGNAVLSKWRISDVSIVRLHPLYDLLYEEKKEGMARGERRLGGRMALFATTHIGNDTILLVSVHGHAGSKGHLFQEDAMMVCNEIQRRNATNVLLGGDTGPPFINPLVSDCGFYPLEKTNKKNGRRFQPTWRVDCPNGDAPRAKFARGDWLLARGGGFSSLGGADDNTSLSVVYPYIMRDTKYECVSDHAMIAMETDFISGMQ
ncbi:hypothetical protein QTG54_010081 [Skeletonema marinoi]|uniref:LicD/FKTN/FKRP nucleotidyltransferase domain-containing protein n=1 Tax=Skeletonema marinoi TaxID=267567 RepID=A0AAD8Y4R0_9STRA|nr:hypothetical protein QTG54_010081 [Skeletonema marinoi]